MGSALIPLPWLRRLRGSARLMIRRRIGRKARRLTASASHPAWGGRGKRRPPPYSCECKGLFRRLGHAVISTVISRRGDDGHRIFSFPDLVAPYAGSMTAVYAWYPRRYDAM